MHTFQSLKGGGAFKRKLFKTKLCKSLLTDTACSYGPSCRFAHHLGELNYTNCLFGEQCYFIEYVDGRVENRGAKQCNHLHPGETKDCYLRRVGLDKYKNRVALEAELTSLSDEFVITAPLADIVKSVQQAIDNGKRAFRVVVADAPDNTNN